MSVKLNFGIIGIGNWGKNLVRDFSKYGNIEKCTSRGNPKNINWIKKNYPSIEYVSNQKKIFNDERINAIIISTPIKSHFSLIKKALLAKKHVFVEKPLCTDIRDANELIKIGQLGEEYGTTTGRKRIVNYLNLTKLVKAINLSGTTHLIISKCDIVDTASIYKFYINDALYIFNNMKQLQDEIRSYIIENCKLIIEIVFSFNPETIYNYT